MNIYLVGGCVRDQLLGLPIKDQDYVVVGATPEQMLGQGFKQVGKDFPVFLHPTSKEEYALARTERKTGKGYYEFAVNFDPNVTLEEDLIRRDLTINAIAKSLDGTIIDPFNGRQDITNKILRHISPAFIEDPVRILRVARFAARFKNLGFSVAPETMKLMQEMVANNEVDALVPERVWQEMQLALATDAPEEFFLILRKCGALARIFPELDKLWGVPQKPEYHPEIDTGVHIMMALQQSVKITKSTLVRFAVLCHDLGKGITPEADLPSHRGHEERGVKLVQGWCNRYKVPNDYRDLAVKVARYHLHAHRVFEMRAETIVKLFQSLDAFRKPTILEDYIMSCFADATGREGLQNKPYPNADFLKEAYKAACDVDVAMLQSQGLSGAKLGTAINEVRVQQVAKFTKQYGTNK